MEGGGTVFQKQMPLTPLDGLSFTLFLISTLSFIS